MADTRLLQNMKGAVQNSVTVKEIESAMDAINDGMKVAARIMKYVHDMEFEESFYCEECKRRGVSIGEAGKALAYVAKTVNEISRLLHFDRGEADSRVDSTGQLSDLLRVLKPEQMEKVVQWMRENEHGTDRDPDSLLPQ